MAEQFITQAEAVEEEPLMEVVYLEEILLTLEDLVVEELQEFITVQLLQHN